MKSNVQRRRRQRAARTKMQMQERIDVQSAHIGDIALRRSLLNRSLRHLVKFVPKDMWAIILTEAEPDIASCLKDFCIPGQGP